MFVQRLQTKQKNTTILSVCACVHVFSSLLLELQHRLEKSFNKVKYISYCLSVDICQ